MRRHVTGDAKWFHIHFGESACTTGHQVKKPACLPFAQTHTHTHSHRHTHTEVGPTGSLRKQLPVQCTMPAVAFSFCRCVQLRGASSMLFFGLFVVYSLQTQNVSLLQDPINHLLHFKLKVKMFHSVIKSLKENCR